MSNEVFVIGNAPMRIGDLNKLVFSDQKVRISDERIKQVTDCRQFLEQKLKNTDTLYYGINTGFGALCNVHISHDENVDLQYNLIRSHAVGAGNEVPVDIVKLILLLKIQSLSLGKSAIRPETIDRLKGFFNAGIFPVIYELGSLGASGDLAPLAHLSLPLIGEGEVWMHNEKLSAADVLHRKGWQALELGAKEGLALLNGTQFTTGYMAYCLMMATYLTDVSEYCAVLSALAFNCRTEPFEAVLHAIRPHPGQIKVAERIRNLFTQSNVSDLSKSSVQDPYAFRCIPQVHGATRDCIDHVRQIVETEMNSVSDNPNVFADEDLILSGGNFHAQPVALVADFLAIGLSEYGSISERRTYQLLCGHRGLPDFLIQNAGLNSGFMIAQYTSASIVSQNKQLCTPASVDSIISSKGQEDHVSMGANAATKCLRVVENLERILAIEFMTAMQALDFRKDLKLTDSLAALHSEYRKKVPFIQSDVALYVHLRETQTFLREQFLS